MSATVAYYKKKIAEQKEQIQLLRQVAEHISGHWDLQDVLAATTEVLTSYMKSDSCFVYLEENGELVLTTSSNPHKKELRKVRLALGEGVTGWAAKHKTIVALHQRAHQDPRFKAFSELPEDKYESFVAVPITAKNKLVGAITLQSKRRVRYTKEKILFLEIIAAHIGGAIDNARLVTETDMLRESLVARKVIERAKGLLMQHYKLSEEEAHALLNKKSMDARKSLHEIAEAIVVSADIVKGI